MELQFTVEFTILISLESTAFLLLRLEGLTKKPSTLVPNWHTRFSVVCVVRVCDGV